MRTLVQYAVTQAEWEAMMMNNPNHFKGATLPVDDVSWEDAQKFIDKLNNIYSSYQYRLPTEAEWEYACRAGSTGDYAGDLDNMGWYWKNSDSKTHPVGQKQPNAWGLYDMHGNVYEWCQDQYISQYYASSPIIDPQGPIIDPQGPSLGVFKISRGGCWGVAARACRSAARNYCQPWDSIGGGNGFRLVRIPR